MAKRRSAPLSVTVAAGGCGCVTAKPGPVSLRVTVAAGGCGGLTAKPGSAALLVTVTVAAGGCGGLTEVIPGLEALSWRNEDRPHYR
jgi:hypothetical protein